MATADDTQLTSPSASGSLQIGAVQKAGGLVKDRAGKLGEQRLTDLGAEIASLSG